MAAFLEADEPTQQQWLAEGMPKVVLKVNTEAELLKLQEQAQAETIPVYLVADAGKTVLSEGTITCLGLGPATEDELNTLTGELKLL